MMIRVLLYLCAVLSGLVWFFQAVRDITKALTGDNAIVFLTFTAAIGLSAVADAIDNLHAAEEKKPPGSPEEKSNGAPEEP